VSRETGVKGDPCLPRRDLVSSLRWHSQFAGIGVRSLGRLHAHDCLRFTPPALDG